MIFGFWDSLTDVLDLLSFPFFKYRDYTDCSFHAIAPSDIIIFYHHFSKILNSHKGYSVLRKAPSVQLSFPYRETKRQGLTQSHKGRTGSWTQEVAKFPLGVFSPFGYLTVFQDVKIGVRILAFSRDRADAKYPSVHRTPSPTRDLLAPVVSV